MYFSDHRALLFQCNVNLKINKPNKQITLHDFEKINEGLLNIGQEAIDIDTFMLKFSDLVKNCTVNKSHKLGNGEKKAWIDRDLRVELKKRNELFKLKKRNPNNLIYRDEFNRVKKRVAAKINDL